MADLKYKRVYVTSIDALMQAPVWEKARTLRPTHAAEIFHAQKLAADKMEIKMIETGKIEAKGDMEKKVRCTIMRLISCVALVAESGSPRASRPSSDPSCLRAELCTGSFCPPCRGFGFELYYINFLNAILGICL